jgi:alpha-beta hydrolase superfamily lysophospholipase
VRSFDLGIDVTGVTGLTGEQHTAVTVHLPDRVDAPLRVIFAFPGGGFGRGYYDVQTVPGYSEAKFHTDHGLAFVACDHLGVGESSLPDMFALTYENLAEANRRTVDAVLAGLRAGDLIEGADPIATEAVVGIGQSMGGCLLTVQQANHETFDGVALLGWSGVSTNFPAPDGSRLQYPMPARGTDLRPIAETIFAAVSPDDAHFRFCFHWPDEDPALMEADLTSYRPYTGRVRGDEATPWGSATVPACAITMMTPGSVAAEAAAITVPVLVACGERDVNPDPWAEPTAYRGTRDVSMRVIPRMAHMHNFAQTRAELWKAIEHFVLGVEARVATPAV